MISGDRLSSYDSTHTSPSKDVTAQRFAEDPTTEPHFSPGTSSGLAIFSSRAIACKILMWMASCEKKVYEHGDNAASNDVVQKAISGLEAENASADAK